MIQSKILHLTLSAFLVVNAQSSFASGKHDESQENEESGHDHDQKEDHAEGKGDAHKSEEGDEHAHGAEGEEHGETNKSVGPDKGILEASEKSGFKLSQEAWKNFGIRTIEASGPGVYTLAKRSIFFGLEERNVYRLRDGFFKRVDFKTISKSNAEYRVQIQDLIAGDQIVTAGLGYLRIAEMAAFGGVGEGHSH
ncbi:MAG: helix-turn-helix transcriptional regulator [Bdellovibrionales bacterium]|nr:helix-turn-helix transcriptional regulator [Bdellovibrionales bacterium]